MKDKLGMHPCITIIICISLGGPAFPFNVSKIDKVREDQLGRVDKRENFYLDRSMEMEDIMGIDDTNNMSSIRARTKISAHEMSKETCFPAFKEAMVGKLEQAIGGCSSYLQKKRLHGAIMKR